MTLAEAAIGGPYAAGGFGAAIVLDGYAPDVSLEGLLYGEDMGRVVVSCAPGGAGGAARALPASTACRRSRRAGSGQPAARWNSGSGAGCSAGAIGSLRQTYFEAIPRRMRQPDADRSAGA